VGFFSRVALTGSYRMAVDLKLIGFRYSIITLVFFTTYVVFQFPATIIIKKVGPRFFLPLITLLWGVVMGKFLFENRDGVKLTRSQFVTFYSAPEWLFY
jgi:hypothetical protein